MGGADMSGVGSLTRSVKDITSKWDKPATATVGTNVEYGPDQEFNSRTGKPYLRPAAERTGRQMRRFAEQADGSQALVMLAALHCEGIAKELVNVDTGNLRASIEAREE